MVINVKIVRSYFLCFLKYSVPETPEPVLYIYHVWVDEGRWLPYRTVQVWKEGESGQALRARARDHLQNEVMPLSCGRQAPWPVCSLRQVRFGAVQRSVVAHVQSGHPGPYLLPSRPLCGAHSVVQCHHEYTLIGKALVLSGSVPSPCNLSPRNLRHSEIPHFLLWRPLCTVPHCDSFSAGTCHFCGVQYQSDSLTLLSWTWKLPRAVTFSQCYSVCGPQPLGHRKFFCWFLRGK